MVNVVSEQNMQKEIVDLNTKVLALESDYVKAKNEITIEKAKNLGFIATNGQKFVSKTPGPVGVAVNLE